MDSAVEGFQHGLRVDLRDSEQRAGGSFGMAVALFPILERARTDADERGKLGLAEPEFLADRPRIGPRTRGDAGCGFFAAQNGSALLETGGELEEKFVFHGYSVSMMDLRILSWSGVRSFCALLG